MFGTTGCKYYWLNCNAENFIEAKKHFINIFLDHFIGWNFGKVVNNDEELIIRTNDKGKIISNLKDEYLVEEINGLKFRIDINSFFQVNNYICSKVFDFIESELLSEIGT